MAWGMSNGSPAFVVGSAAGTPARWSLAAPAQVTRFALTSGAANGILPLAFAMAGLFVVGAVALLRRRL